MHIRGLNLKNQKTKSNNKYTPSSPHPCVLASERLQYWTSPHAVSHCNDITSRLPISATSTLLRFMLLSLEEKTCSNYGTGLLRFTQFCDSHNISEADRCPASEVIISAFIASYANLCSLDCINRWLSGIKWWHTFQGAEWNGRDMLATVKKGIAKLVPNSSRRDKREPVTLERMHCLLRGLDLSNAKDAAIYAASSIAFHGICRFANNKFMNSFMISFSRRVSPPFYLGVRVFRPLLLAQEDWFHFHFMFTYLKPVFPILGA